MKLKFRISDFVFRNFDSRLRRCFGGQARGIVLIMVLWVVAVLSVIVLEFCFAMRTEVNITKNYKEELQSYAMAEGGVQRAILELIYIQDPRVQQLRKPSKLEETPPEKREWVTDGRPYLLSYDQGVCEIRVMSEAGKVNINLISEQMIRKILENLGVDSETKEIIADSIMDWRDPDDFYRVNGAENDYYQSLKEPYFCKNGPLSSIEEMLLIRGITPDLFYGKKRKGEEKAKEQRTGLKDIFSIYSPMQQIDINSATAAVLRIALGISPEMARNMVEAREEKAFENQGDLLQRVPELAPLIGQIGLLITYKTTTPYYTIESRARNQEGGSKRGIKVIVKIASTEKKNYKIIQWLDVLL
jgi:general secretion pathway protein K